MSVWVILEYDEIGGSIVGVVSSRERAKELSGLDALHWEEWDIDGEKVDWSGREEEARQERTRKRVQKAQDRPRLSPKARKGLRSLAAVRRPLGARVTSGDPDLDVHAVRWSHLDTEGHREALCGRYIPDAVILPREGGNRLRLADVTCPECEHVVREGRA